MSSAGVDRALRSLLELVIPGAESTCGVLRCSPETVHAFSRCSVSGSSACIGLCIAISVSLNVGVGVVGNKYLLLVIALGAWPLP